VSVPDPVFERHVHTTRRRLEVQGFLGLSDAELLDVGPWMRFTPSRNFVLTMAGTATGSVPLLVGLAVSMAVGALWLGATAAFLASGHRATADVFGFLMAALILPLATVQVCVLSEAMARFLGPPHATARRGR
jgi:hypothetical protein